MRRQHGPRPRVRREPQAPGPRRRARRPRALRRAARRRGSRSRATPRPTCSSCRRAPRRTAWWSPKRLPAACRSSQPMSAASRRPSVTERKERGQGLLVPRDDPAALAAALQALARRRRGAARLALRRTRAARVARSDGRPRPPSWRACWRRRRDDRRAHPGQRFDGSTSASLPTPRRAPASSSNASRPRLPAIGADW